MVAKWNGHIPAELSTYDNENYEVHDHLPSQYYRYLQEVCRLFPKVLFSLRFFLPVSSLKLNVYAFPFMGIW